MSFLSLRTVPLMEYNFGRDNSWDLASRLLDREFGMDSDFFPSRMPRGFLLRPMRSMQDDAGISEVRNDPDKFKVMLNVSHFKPNELEVKTVDNSILIRGKHEERSDEHGFVSREFSRRYLLPEVTEPEAIVSTLTPNGFLVIEAPKKAIEAPSNERVVPINLQQSEAN